MKKINISPRSILVISSALVILLIISAIFYWQNINTKKIGADYQWSDTNLQARYADLSWNKISTKKLLGFSPKITLVEKRTEGCNNDVIGVSYLRTEGYLCNVGYWLEELDGTKIDSKEKLIARFAPIESEAEAVSFLTVTERDFIVDWKENPIGYTATTEDGFLVQLAYTYNCVSNEPVGHILKVSTNGEVSTIATETPKPLKPGELLVCVD